MTAMVMPLQDCYIRRTRAFSDHFTLATGSRSAEAIHEMRVDLKRLRTFFNLAGAIGARFDAGRAFAPARRLFRAAGRVRNLQVLEVKVREDARALELSEYYNYLKEDEGREAGKLTRVFRRFSPDFFASAWLSMAPFLEGPTARPVLPGIKARFSILITEVREAKSMRRDSRGLHFLRTKAKEARYTLEIIQECGLSGDEGTRLNGHLRDVHQALGLWHDDEIALDSLREFRRCRATGPLFSARSYLDFASLTRAHQADALGRFGSAYAALLTFLGDDDGRRIFRSPRPAHSSR
jgi:CHAD domain-containing protein